MLYLNYNDLQGAPECHQEVRTVVQDRPSEECHLQPRRTCKAATKLVPALRAEEECVQVPREVCTNHRGNQRIVKKPLIKKWCYAPSGQSVPSNSN